VSGRRPHALGRLPSAQQRLAGTPAPSSPAPSAPRWGTPSRSLPAGTRHRRPTQRSWEGSGDGSGSFGSDLCSSAPSLGPACGCCGRRTCSRSRDFRGRAGCAPALLLGAGRLPPKEAFAVPAHEAQKCGNWGQETAPGWGRHTAGACACPLLLVPPSRGARPCWQQPRPSTALLRHLPCVTACQFARTWKFMRVTPIFVFTPVNT